jgi:hypothetical protein
MHLSGIADHDVEHACDARAHTPGVDHVAWVGANGGPVATREFERVLRSLLFTFRPEDLI